MRRHRVVDVQQEAGEPGCKVGEEPAWEVAELSANGFGEVLVVVLLRSQRWFRFCVKEAGG